MLNCYLKEHLFVLLNTILSIRFNLMPHDRVLKNHLKLFWMLLIYLQRGIIIKTIFSCEWSRKLVGGQPAITDLTQPDSSDVQ